MKNVVLSYEVNFLNFLEQSYKHEIKTVSPFPVQQIPEKGGLSEDQNCSRIPGQLTSFSVHKTPVFSVLRWEFEKDRITGRT